MERACIRSTMLAMDALLSYLPDFQTIASLGYWFVFLAALGESIAFLGFFVPGSIVVVISGGMAAQGVYDLRTLFYVVVAAALTGNTIGYLLGRHGKKILKKYPPLWKHLEQGQSFFKRHGGKSIFLGHFLGPLRHLIPMVAGLAEMPFLPFQLVNIASILAWSAAHIAVGFVFGGLWDIALLWLSRFGIAIVLVIAVVALFAWTWEWVLKQGRESVKLLRSLFSSVIEIIGRQPNVKKFLARHETSVSFVADRFSMRSFFGLPFTLLTLVFLYAAALLTDLVQEIAFPSSFSALDERIAHLLFDFRHPVAAGFFYFITLFAQTGVIIAVMFFLTLLLWRKRHAIFAFGLWLTLFLSELLTQGGKILFQRLRPDELLRAISEDSFSFPSMHAATAAAFTGYIAYMVIRTSRSWTLKVGAVFTSIIAILLIDLSRMYLGLHYLSDVVAGDLVGLLCVAIVISITEWLFAREKGGIPALPMNILRNTAIFQAIVVICLFFLVPSPLLQQSPPPPERISVAAMQNLFKDGALPRTTQTLAGAERQPLNVLLLGSRKCMMENLERAGWVRADDISIAATYRLVRSVVLREEYPSAPFAPAFYYSAPHTFGYSKMVGEDERRPHLHARLWETDYDTNYGRLFATSVSYDTRTRWGISHSIDPAIDTQRNNLLRDLLRVGAVGAYQLLPFTPRIPDNAEAGTMYKTDGKAVLIFLNGCSS